MKNVDQLLLLEALKRCVIKRNNLIGFIEAIQDSLNSRELQPEVRIDIAHQLGDYRKELNEVNLIISILKEAIE